MDVLRIRIDDRHELRQRQPADAEEMFALTDANRVHLRRWLPWLDFCTTVEDTRRSIESTLLQTRAGTGLAASLIEDGRIIGVISFNDINLANRTGMIGYWLAATHEGRGLMTATVRAWVAHGFTALNLNRQVISCAVDNTRSRAIPARLGFRSEGVARESEWLYDHFVDLEIYAQTRAEWKARTIPSSQDCL